jgi:hypothetical protein
MVKCGAVKEAGIEDGRKLAREGIRHGVGE